MTLRVGLTHPALTKLTFMDYILTMLRNRLRRKHSYDSTALCRVRPYWNTEKGTQLFVTVVYRRFECGSRCLSPPNVYW